MDPVAMTPETTSRATAPKAGRNLAHAVGVGVGLGAVILLSLLVRREAFLVVLCAAVLVGSWEMARALGTKGFSVAVVPLWIGAVSMNVAAFLRGGEALALTFGLTLVGLLVWRVADGIGAAIADLAASVLVALYPCFLAGFAALMLAEDDGHLRILLFIIVTVASDIGGYVVGVLIGRHPMAPSVSPKKSWEGFAGSVAFCAVAGALCLHLMFDGSYAWGLVIGVVTGVAATVGDLVESLVKRDLGIKDMGNLLPGHGGIMDRLDSLVITAPLIWGLLIHLVPQG